MRLKLTDELITSIAKDIEVGLSIKDACDLNDITRRVFYHWLETAETSKEKPARNQTKKDKLCQKFAVEITKAKLRGKRQLIKDLRESNTPVSKMFLLRNRYPQEFHKQPFRVPNFDMLFEHTRTEYSQADHDQLWQLITRMETDRQKRVAYDEDSAFREESADEVSDTDDGKRDH